jgi:hypothetical protein
MVVSPGSSHPSWVDVVRHDVVVVGELYMAECALPVLFDNLAVEQPPHLRVGAEFPVSPRMMGVFNPLHPNLIDPRDWLPATAAQRAMDGTILIAAKFHRFSPDGFAVEMEEECGLVRVRGRIFARRDVA